VNKPREGNVPGFHTPHNERDLPDNRQPLERKVESGLAEVKRDTRRNRMLAHQQNWSEGDWQHFLETGNGPGSATSSITVFNDSVPQEPYEISERLHNER
jgi:hypothetical protein